jgi:hypothetical protein
MTLTPLISHFRSVPILLGEETETNFAPHLKLFLFWTYNSNNNHKHLLFGDKFDDVGDDRGRSIFGQPEIRQCAVHTYSQIRFCLSLADRRSLNGADVNGRGERTLQKENNVKRRKKSPHIQCYSGRNNKSDGDKKGRILIATLTRRKASRALRSTAKGSRDNDRR